MKPSLPVAAHIDIQPIKVVIHGLAIWAYVARVFKPSPSNVLRLLLLVAISCFLFPLTARTQTTILVVVTSTEIIIGADSRVLAERKGQSIAGTICKIHQVKGVFFSPAYLTISPATGYDVNAIAVKAFSNNRKFLDNVTQFEGDVIEPLQRALVWTKQDDPDSFKKSLEDLIALDIAFATFEGASPIVSLRRFISKTTKEGKIKVSIERKDCSGECAKGYFRFLGHGQAANNVIAKHPSIWSEQGIVDTVRLLISVEIKDQPSQVGGPIDIVRITKDGANWIQRKPECEEKKAQPAKPTPDP